MDWQETLALGSTVSVRHLAVSRGVFLALAEADFRQPGDVVMTAYVSSDGATWTTADLPPDLFADVVLLEFAGGPAGFIGIGAVIGDETASEHLVWTSPDGVVWTRSELPIGLDQASNPYVVTTGDLFAVAVTDSFVIAGQTRRYLDTMRIIADHQPDFEWPEFAYMATEPLESGDVQLTIGGAEGKDFVATFSALGIDPAEFAVERMESDWFTVPLGSLLWTSTNGADWIERPAPMMVPHMGRALPIDATDLGLFAHGLAEDSGGARSWYSDDGSEWVELELPGWPLVDWSGGVYTLDQAGRLWLSSDGRSWTETGGPGAISDSREVFPTAGAPDGVIALVGIRPDAVWQDARVPESWLAVSADGESWWEATGIGAFGMPIWPDAIAVDGDRVVIGMVGEPPSAMPQTYLWLGTVTAP